MINRLFNSRLIIIINTLPHLIIVNKRKNRNSNISISKRLSYVPCRFRRDNCQHYSIWLTHHFMNIYSIQYWLQFLLQWSRKKILVSLFHFRFETFEWNQVGFILNNFMHQIFTITREQFNIEISTFLKRSTHVLRKVWRHQSGNHLNT